MDTQEAADLLGITTRRVRQLIEEGALSAQRVANGYQLDDREVHNYRLTRLGERAMARTTMRNLMQHSAGAEGKEEESAPHLMTYASLPRDAESPLDALVDAVDDLMREVRFLRRQQVRLVSEVAHMRRVLAGRD